jgi:hypothetical protein
MEGHVRGLSQRGVKAVAIDLPVRRAEAAVPAFVAAMTARLGRAEPVVGGQSYGGRVASLLAAERPLDVRGLVCFSYPLHRPGQPDWQERSAHWTTLEMPVLLLSGEADPFARRDLLRRAVEERLPRARLVTWPGLGHSLLPVLDEVLDVTADFVRQLAGGPAD